jgi:predicted short-subunit dehydrogenase-like oxidoreductase (DUF2520 family)
MKQSLSIIGAGKVGRVLGQLFNRHQIFTIHDVLNCSLKSSVEACEFIGAGNAITDFSAMRNADVFMVTVPDDQINACSLRLQERGLITPSTIVFHCSGALDSSELGNVKGAASLHPLRSFADPLHVAQHFIPTICTLEGDEHARAHLTLACQKIGAQIVAINREGKTLYHAAAVFASNYLVTLMDAALQTFEAAGIEPDMALRMAKPLAQETFNNVFQMGAQQALTGPIARGDSQTVERHCAALKKWDKNMAALYVELAKSTKKMKDRN